MRKSAYNEIFGHPCTRSRSDRSWQQRGLAESLHTPSLAHSGVVSNSEAKRANADVERRLLAEPLVRRHPVVDGVDLARVHRADVHAVQRGPLIDDLLERGLVVLVDETLLHDATMQGLEQLLRRVRREQLDADRL